MREDRAVGGLGRARGVLQSGNGGETTHRRTGRCISISTARADFESTQRWVWCLFTWVLIDQDIEDSLNEYHYDDIQAGLQAKKFIS